MWQKFRALDQRIWWVIGITLLVGKGVAVLIGSPSSRAPTAWASLSDEDKAINTVCWSDSVAASADDGNGWVVGENSVDGTRYIQSKIREIASGEWLFIYGVGWGAPFVIGGVPVCAPRCWCVNE